MVTLRHRGLYVAGAVLLLADGIALRGVRVRGGIPALLCAAVVAAVAQWCVVVLVVESVERYRSNKLRRPRFVGLLVRRVCACLADLLFAFLLSSLVLLSSATLLSERHASVLGAVALVASVAWRDSLFGGRSIGKRLMRLRTVPPSASPVTRFALDLPLAAYVALHLMISVTPSPSSGCYHILYGLLSAYFLVQVPLVLRTGDTIVDQLLRMQVRAAGGRRGGTPTH